MNELRKSWTLEQDQAILSIVEQIGTKNWPLVSQLMKEKYHLFNRSGKQCRQRWYNQLNPQLNKHPWNAEQQEKLFQAHRKYGNRWIQISKQFEGRYQIQNYQFRTDNAIKNHFYSTIRRSMRRICKILGNRNSTSKLRNIRPSILSEIFQFSKTQSSKSISFTKTVDIASIILEYAKTKPGRNYEFNFQSKDDLQNLVNKLIVLNEEYVKFKQSKRKSIVKVITSKKIKKSCSQKVKLSLDESGESASTLPHGQLFEKQHRKSVQEYQTKAFIFQKNKISEVRNNCVISTSIQKVNHSVDEEPAQIQQSHSQNSQQSRQMDIQSLEDQYLIIRSISKSASIHYKMFDSRQNFDLMDTQHFHYLEKPSLQQIIYENEEHQGNQVVYDSRKSQLIFMENSTDEKMHLQIEIRADWNQSNTKTDILFFIHEIAYSSFP